MLKRFVYSRFSMLGCVLLAAFAQTQRATDVVMMLPFENTSGKPEFNWVGESFADSLSDLLRVPTLNVISNGERKIIQQRLRIPLTTLPSLATSLKLARESKATLLIAGKYNIVPAGGDTAATINVTAKIIRVNEGRFLSEDHRRAAGHARHQSQRRARQSADDAGTDRLSDSLSARQGACRFRRIRLIEAANKVPGTCVRGIYQRLADAARPRHARIILRTRCGFTPRPRRTARYSDAALELGHLYLGSAKIQRGGRFV